MATEELEIDEQTEEKDPYSDLSEISSRIDKILSNDKFSRALFESEWARNVFFIAGAMWLKKVGGRWQKRDLPEWFPRAQTNKFAEKFNDLVTQLIQGGRVPISYIPATDDEADIGTAEVGDRIRDVFYTEACVDEKSIDLASWLIATGNVFGIPHYDMDPSYGMVTAPRLNCPCGTQLSGDELVDGACPECGAPADQMQPAQDEAGNPLVDEYPIGALQLDIASPFEIRGDYRITNIRKWSRFVRQRRYELDWAKEHWPDFKDSIIPDGGTEDVAQYYLDLISNLTSSFAIGSGVMSNGPNSKAPKVTAYEIYELPSEEFPQGLRAVRLGDSAQTVVEAGPLPSEYGAGVKQGKKFLPLIHWGALKLPGRLWYKSPLDDVVPLQVFRNMVEANIRLSIQRMGNAIWLLPKGCGVDILTGEPGQQVSYNPVSVGGTQFAKPERMSADLNNLGAMISMLKVIDDAIERVSGTFFLQGGCVTERTECLTRYGWRRYSELTKGEEIFAFDPRLEKSVWSTVKDIHIYPDYVGDLYEVRGQQISGEFTLNHGWYVGNVDDCQRKLDKKSGIGRPRVRPDGIHRLEMQDIKTHHYNPTVTELVGPEADISDAFLSYLGWLFSDGYYLQRAPDPGPPNYCNNWRYSAAITQSEKANKKKCQLIRAVLQDCGFSWTEHKKKKGVIEFHINGSKAKEIIDMFPDKRPGAEFIASLSGRQAKILVASMMLGDGHTSYHDGKRKHYSSRYYTADPRLAEEFQMLATIAGYTTACNRSERKKPRKNNRPRYENAIYKVSLKATTRINWMRTLEKTKRVAFSGLVWCPETEHDTWIARCDGKVFITGNSAPPGVTAASALAYLGEQGSKALSTLRTNWALGWREFDMMSLEIIRKNWDDQRMRTVAGKNRKWQVEKFSKADLQGSVNLIIDYNGLAPKSNATERAAIAQLIQLGIVNPQDNEMQIEVLKKFGELDLKGSLNIDIEDAAKEQDRFLNDPNFIPQVRPFVDNSTVHLHEHTDFAKTDEFRELPAARQQVWYGHIENTVHDIVMRRVMLTQAGLDPDVPALAEVPSGDAQIAAQQAAAMQNGGVPNGAQGPDQRLNADGTAKPQAAPANAQLPDIADQGVQQSVAQQNQTPASITPPGSPRRIDIPGGGQ